MMTRSRYWVGLDVGADLMACCIIDAVGDVILEQSLPARAVELQSVLRPIKRRVSLVALEAGATSAHLARSLLARGYPVSLLDTRQVSKFLTIYQNKTDRNDARCLAEIARIGNKVVSNVRIRSVENQRLRSMLVMRQSLVRMRVAAEGTMRSLIRLNGGRLKKSTSATTLRRNVTEALSQIRKTEKIDLREEIGPVLSLCENLRRYIEHLNRSLALTAEQNPQCRRFMEIPGVGPICALSFYTAIDEPFRFKRNADVGAYLGLTPRLRQSGQAIVRLRISKMGNKMTRTHLVTAAAAHLRCGDTAIRDWGIRIRERVGSGRSRVAVARKLAVTMLAIWKSGRGYEPFPLRFAA